MSGTSADGVSAALVSFKGRKFRLLIYRTFPYPAAIRKKILNVGAPPGGCPQGGRGGQPLHSVREISSLHFELGKIFADAALKILKISKINPRKITVIGSHGQTLYHGPRDTVPSTFQIGESAVIAARTGIPVVSDFRPGDMALGGEGAPLIPFFDFYFYGRGPLRAFQNIGGIANVTIVGKSLKKPIAFDTGPGNCLIDLAVRRMTKGRFSHDPGGRWAHQGSVEMEWVREAASHPYFRRRPPKSTGPEEFGETFLNKFFGPRLRRRPLDVLATLTFLTAFTIYKSLKKFSPLRLQEVVVSGGGVFNFTLMRHLGRLFTPVPVRSVEEWGIPAQAKEPIAFSFFALRALKGQINHLPSVTGARGAAILGKIISRRPAYAHA